MKLTHVIKKNLINSLRMYLSSNFNDMPSTMMPFMSKMSLNQLQRSKFSIGEIKEKNSNNGKYYIRGPYTDSRRKFAGFRQSLSPDAQKIISGNDDNAYGKTAGFHSPVAGNSQRQGQQSEKYAGKWNGKFFMNFYS